MLYFFIFESFLFGVAVGILINILRAQQAIDGWQRALDGWEEANDTADRALEVVNNLGDLITKKSMTKENTAEEGAATPNATPPKNVGFEFALESLKAGFKWARAGWNGKGMWIALQIPDENSKMGLPYLYMSTVDGKLVPWLASQTDLLSQDWEIVA